jgi:hypothetical protein
MTFDHERQLLPERSGNGIQDPGHLSDYVQAGAGGQRNRGAGGCLFERWSGGGSHGNQARAHRQSADHQPSPLCLRQH